MTVSEPPVKPGGMAQTKKQKQWLLQAPRVPISGVVAGLYGWYGLGLPGPP